MKHIDMYREASRVKRCAEDIHRSVTRPWTLMEVCGGQTNTILKYGLEQLLPNSVRLIHGPGCPVCVTPIEVLDKAHEIAMRPEVIFCTFGDMLRVPGSTTDLYQIKAGGGDVRVVYSPMDALAMAERHPDRELVFFAVGFETTAPANAMSAFLARARGVGNFSLLVSHALVPPALQAILRSDGCEVQGFLAAGHVCAIMGIEEYRPLATAYRVPIVVTGFEPLDILQGVLMCVRQLEAGRHEVENQYARAVSNEGNERARELMREVFTVTDRNWRGIGTIAHSGFGLSDAYRGFDALERFGGLQASALGIGASECVSGQVLQGKLRPIDCPAFGTRCSPEHPLGATMVSDEGACAAYYRYRSVSS